MRTAMRSFTEPPGLKYSTLARTRGASGPRWRVTEVSRTSGVLPTRSTTDSAYCTGPSSCGPDPARVRTHPTRTTGEFPFTGGSYLHERRRAPGYGGLRACQRCPDVLAQRRLRRGPARRRARRLRARRHVRGPARPAGRGTPCRRRRAAGTRSHARHRPAPELAPAVAAFLD